MGRVGDGLNILPGKYLLGDLGFPLTQQLLVPYHGVWYHLAEWGCVIRTCVHCMAPIHFLARSCLLPLPVCLCSLIQPIPLLANHPVTISVSDQWISQITLTLLNAGDVP
jgi:hypothetical protein